MKPYTNKQLTAAMVEALKKKGVEGDFALTLMHLNHDLVTNLLETQSKYINLVSVIPNIVIRNYLKTQKMLDDLIFSQVMRFADQIISQHK